MRPWQAQHGFTFTKQEWNFKLTGIGALSPIPSFRFNMNLGILLWNTCNLECAHCAVNSGPREKSYLTNDEIFKIIDSAFVDDTRPAIGLSGGEAFIHYKRLKRIIKYATDKGARVSINTNGYWGNTIEKAEKIVSELINLKVTKIVISIDDFHEDYLEAENPINVIRACKNKHLEVWTGCQSFG